MVRPYTPVMEFIIAFVKLSLLSAVLLCAQDVAAFHPLRTKTSLATFNADITAFRPEIEDTTSLLISQVYFYS